MSDILDEVKRTPIPFKQKLTLGLLSLVILCSGMGIGASLTFNHLKDRLRPPGPTPPSFMDRLDRVAKEYSLTPQQKEQVKPVLETYHESLKQMFTNSMQTMTTAKEALVAGMEEVLTPEQYEKWHKDLLDREKRHGRRPSGRRGDRGSWRDRSRGGPPPWERDANRMADPNRATRWQREGRERAPDTSTPSPEAR